MVLFADSTMWFISERIRGVREDVLYKLTLPLPTFIFTVHRIYTKAQAGMACVLWQVKSLLSLV